MLRTAIVYVFRLSVLSVLFIMIARSEWRARRRKQRAPDSLGSDNTDLDGVLRQGKFGFHTRAGRRVR